jgi:lactoylglutathione lyase
VHDPSRCDIVPGDFSHLVISVDDVRATVRALADDGFASEAPSSPNGSDTFWTAMLTDPTAAASSSSVATRGHERRRPERL